ncbi:unnamed protein product, partial [Coregonus sp. 'balchen']
TGQMMIVAGDYSLSTFEGTEQYSKPHRLIPHSLYKKTTNNTCLLRGIPAARWCVRGVSMAWYPGVMAAETLSFQAFTWQCQ